MSSHVRGQLKRIRVMQGHVRRRPGLWTGLAAACLAVLVALVVVRWFNGPAGTGEPATAGGVRPCYEDVQNGGLPITRSGDVFTYGAEANRQWARSESIWSTSAVCPKLRIGERVTYSFDILPRLGNTGTSVWQTVSQLQGPTVNGTWPGPPVALVIESGQWRIAGGYAVPTGYGGFRSDFGYTKHLSPVKENTWHHWTFDVLLAGPGTGSVSAWLDGARVVDGFKPPRGTMYTGGGGYSHAYLQLKTGQYTGANNNADTPTWQRTVMIKNVRYGVL